jgi:hypothetical protein
MDLEMVLNDLSMRAPAQDIHTARQWMAEFIGTLYRATILGVKRSLRTHADFHSTVLAPDYPLARWRNDSEVDHDARLFIKSLATKFPFIDTEIESRATLQEFKHNGISAEGLGVACLIDGLAISLKSEEQWNCSRISLEMATLDVEDNLIYETPNVIHASAISHVIEHGGWIHNRLRQGVGNGADLWAKKNELFSSLVFCESIAGHVQNLPSGDPLLRFIVKRLSELQAYCQNWETGPFNPTDLPSRTSIESEATLRRHSHERTFTCPDGQARLFNWHVRIPPWAWRLYFIPLPETRTMIIGYIGPHLPTVSDPT